MEHLRPKIGNQGLIAASLRIVAWLKSIIVLLLIIEVFLTCCNIVGSFDFPWQLAEGEYIVAQGHSPSSVLQAYGEVSPHFANEYILYEVLIAIVNRAAGWIGLCIFFGLLCFLIYTPCLLAFLRSGGRFVLIDLCLFFLAQFLINFRLAARPELVADACYVLTGIMLMRWPDPNWSGRQTLALGVTFFLWANAHGSFLLGGVMLALWYGQLLLIYGKSLLLSRDFTWLRPGLAALIGCALNPFGLFRFEQPFVLHGLLWGQATSPEMWPMSYGVAVLPLTWTCAGILALAMRLRERPYYWMIAWLFLLQYLTFYSLRYIIFIGLSLLIITWDGVANPRKPFSPPKFPLAFAIVRLSFYLYIAISLASFIYTGASSKLTTLQDYARLVYPNTRIVTNSSFTWLREHPTPQGYDLLSTVAAGSWAQMPGLTGIHPLMDSGTHRYSDRVNQLYYYALFSPPTFHRVLEKLKINAIIVGSTNISWASLLNGSPDWRLAQIESDSQLYLRRTTEAVDTDRQLFRKWEAEAQRKLTDPADISSERIIRGLGLRSDPESLQMLVKASDAAWASDPQMVYIQDWLHQVPDPLVTEALKSIGDKTDNSSPGLRILLLLRLEQYPQAAELARQWHPAWLNPGYQDAEMLRVEAFIRGGDLQAARKILESLWPAPRYSLRWARLCQQIYAADAKAMPQDARHLTDLADPMDWQDEVIASLNQNILRLSAQAP